MSFVVGRNVSLELSVKQAFAEICTLTGFVATEFSVANEAFVVEDDDDVR